MVCIFLKGDLVPYSVFQKQPCVHFVFHDPSVKINNTVITKDSWAICRPFSSFGDYHKVGIFKDHITSKHRSRLMLVRGVQMNARPLGLPTDQVPRFYLSQLYSTREIYIVSTIVPAYDNSTIVWSRDFLLNSLYWPNFHPR